MPQGFRKYTDARLDGRVKILPSQHREVVRTYKALKSYNATARFYGVSKRLIIFIVNPEKLKQFQADRRTKKVHLEYYDRETHTEAIKKYRSKKRSLNLQYNLSKI